MSTDGSTHSLTAATFSVCALAMVGIPPTGGFFSKFYLILGAIDAGNWVFVGVIVLSSVLALAYLANVLRYMYFPAEAAAGEAGPPPVPEAIGRNEVPWSMLGPMLAVAAAILLLGVFYGEVVARFIEPSIPSGLVR